MIFRKVLSILFLSMATMVASATNYYVKADGSASADGSSWENATTLAVALEKAVAGDQIFVKGYKTPTETTTYFAPNQSGFKLKSGVKLYGGYSGEEASPTGGNIEYQDKIRYNHVYQSVLAGDISKNDTVSSNLILFPENGTRSDNAQHVLTIELGSTSNNANSNNEKTIINGFTLAGGHANNANNNDKNAGHGGGILVINSTGDNSSQRAFEIAQCFFVNNYANQGAALYVDESAKSDNSVVKYCGVFNNVSGTRGSNANTGGGMWIAGSATVHNSVIYNNVNGGLRFSNSTRVVNCTVIHNTSSAADLTEKGTSTNSGGILYNTVLWGSTTLCKAETKPSFKNCAYPEVTVTNQDKGTDDNGNKKISTLNHDATQPAAWFQNPYSTIGYDFSFDFKASTTPRYSSIPEERSALLNAGDVKAYKDLVGESESKDLAGRDRIGNDNTIDIGAYESEQLAAGRRLYVKEGGVGNKDGSDWANAMASVQDAINKLAEGNSSQKGEVWVAEGTYQPTRINNSQDQTVPYSFVMKDGISVYGGFEGNETSLDERDKKRGENSWEFTHPTIFQGNGYNGQTNWNANEEAWSMSSNSCHVVWFAPLPDEQSFTQNTYLDGITIEGGSYNGTGIDAKYNPQYGAGIYMDGSTTVVRNCMIRNNNAGMSVSNDVVPSGGGVYCKSGQVRYSLIYNNSAYQGGGVYIDDRGFVNASMISNNSANNGSAVYMKRQTEAATNYQILATSIITNNTSTRNGAIYVDGSGIIEQSTIANNYTSNVRDSGSRTSGIYIKESGNVINNIIWNNTLQDLSNGKSSSVLAPIYTEGTSRSTALFYNNAISDVNAATWNTAYQSGTYELSSNNIQKTFEMGEGEQYKNLSYFTDSIGVRNTWKDIDYFWKTMHGSILRNKGLSYAEVPGIIPFKPSTSFDNKTFSSRPAIGAYMPDTDPFVFEKTDNVLRLYIDKNDSSPDGNGSSWDKSASSLNEVLNYLGTLDENSTVSYLSATGSPTTPKTLTSIGAQSFEICCREGVFAPIQPYTFQENETQARTFTIPATAYPVTIKGGYAATGNPTDSDRDVEKYRTEINGNINGTKLSEGLYHLFRIEEGANITLDGIAITHGYAAGVAYIPYGGAILIGSVQTTGKTTQVTVCNSILEDNTALYGAAIATIPEAKNVKLTLENCVINNNTCALNYSNDITPQTKNLIELNNGSGNTLTLRHVSFINNYGAAPASGIMTTSLAAGNQVYGADGYTAEGANNTRTLATVGKAGAQNFANPTNEVGAIMNGNVYYGGYAKFRPLTSSDATADIINQVTGNETLTQDITGEERNLGGAPDLGAYEAILPKAGKIIYVRSYNTDWKQGDCKTGMPDFHLLTENPGKEYDGTTWSRAIMGNAICNNNIDRNGNDFYVQQGDSLLAATLDNPLYGNDYNASSAPYGQTSNAFSSFFPSGTSGASNGNRKNVNINGTNYNIIENKREEQYVSGLQYAVEQAAKYNKKHPDDPMSVWVGAGVYTDYKGFVIRDGVKVYGGFSKEGNPGEDDRRPLLSQYVPARKEYESLEKADYETILQVRWETPVYMTTSSKEMWWSEGKPQDGSDFDFIQKAIQNRECQRHYVLYQPDECITTWNIESNPGDRRESYVSADQYRYPGSGMGYEDTQYYREYKDVTWDGFSIRHGYLTNYKANRDGGAGVRVFRGINLENLIIVHNISHGTRSRGGGLYMDGSNSTIKNSYLLENMTGASAPGTPYSGGTDSYGGGAYMLTGTGYNMVVASNRSTGGTCRGGGIFIENAKFYNNTVAYNHAPEGSGIEHWQGDATGIKSALTLYNCLVFENFQDGGADANQIASMEPNSFHAKHCFIKGKMPDGLVTNGTDGNILVSSDDTTINPFTKEFYTGKGTRRFSPVRLENEYHLNEANGLEKNPCLNSGTEEDFDIPATDMDYTNRIKDCAIDIGAYEADNTANIKPQEKENLEGTTEHAGVTDYVYYVTQNGAGNRSGDSPENAACAEKLQSVLTAAGVLAKTENKFGQSDVLANNKKHKVYVKVAGYKPDEDGNRFVYHANTLADPEDPQSYTFLIPDGVWLMGGYYEGGETDKNGQEIPANWDEERRDVITDYRTVLSAKTEPKLGSTISQEVNGYHTVTFGKWPTGNEDDYNKTALTYRAVLDGVYLTEGQATDNAGFKGVGGGAIVPEYAHVRNCFATNNEALKGGAFYTLPGGMISGCVIRNNTAQQGGAIYTANAGKSDRTFHSYIVSCTIVDNTADQGGGIYQELGTIMGGNLVIYGNHASTDKNISGVTDEQYEDAFMRQIEDPAADPIQYYPYNDCFIEKYAMSANTQNTSMDGDEETYFMSSGGYYPRPYSPLVENGVLASYYKGWTQIGVLPYDILGVTRKTTSIENDQTTRLTAGAYAMSLPSMNTDAVLKRLFVSADGGTEQVSDEEKQKYLGRSFYTPFNSLDAALAYIDEVRKNNKDADNDSEHPFEILMTGGTYKPSVTREDDTSTETNDRRRNSFVIPTNVNIYGGFFATDQLSSDPKGSTESFTTIKVGNEDVTLTPNGDIKEILAARNKNHMTDINKNGLIEPWEFANPTIFSGDLKASATEKKAYHVVFSKIDPSDKSSADRDNDVLLDGITIMDGQTADDVNCDEVDENNNPIFDEEGHGGGIYSSYVSYTLNRCRVVNNIAVHGGGIYVKDGSLDIINSIVAGNWAGLESNTLNPSVEGRGGGVFLYLTKETNGNFHALNSIFVNNTASNASRSGGTGGAIYIHMADYEDSTLDSYQEFNVTNSIIASNEANIDGAVHLDGIKPQVIKPSLFNTIIWNNYGQQRTISRADMWHCASDKFEIDPARASADGNVKLDTLNMSATGPRFARPTLGQGSSKNTSDAQWNPASISVLTDAGDGMIPCNAAGEEQKDQEKGKYKDWWAPHLKRLEKYGYTDDYMTLDNKEAYARYKGPKRTDGTLDDKPIDIGLYEFQYTINLSDREALYIGTEDKGKADGSDWDNRSSDLRGAIIAMANPTGNTSTELKRDRKIYVRGGEFYSPSRSTGDAFGLQVSTTNKSNLITSLEIIGACTNETGIDYTQDFSKPTVLVNNPLQAEEETTSSLLNIMTNGKSISLSGLSFQNTSVGTNAGVGLQAEINNTASATDGSLTLNNCSFRKNTNKAMNISNNAGSILIYNTLFADGKSDALVTTGKTTVVNATFVNNDGAAIIGNADVYNTVAWKNTTASASLSTDATKKNVVFEESIANNDVINGPNFTDPENEDYSIRPSSKLLNQGDNTLYQTHVGTAPSANSQKDLGNKSRLTGDNIDIGAYECDSELLPIIYVKAGESGSGASWDSPTNDLQNAINLAELYANNAQKGNDAYVFVDRNIQAKDIDITLPGVHVYGTMNNQTSSKTATSSSTAEEVKEIVEELLGKRTGLLESAVKSTITGINMKPVNSDEATKDMSSVIDGFIVNGQATIQGKGYLSTSIINANVTGNEEGTLYNSLALSSVKDVKCINVTSPNTLPGTTGSYFNRSDVTADKQNKFVKDDYWCYQINDLTAYQYQDENATRDINTDDEAHQNAEPTKACINIVGHQVDLAGNLRIRNNVDNGCFETWFIDYDKEITKEDYPHGKSVVYVAEEAEKSDGTTKPFHELVLADDLYTDANPFKPGFLLLGHHAGLRGNSHYISLDNFAVERKLKVGYSDLCVLPFVNTRVEQIKDDGSIISGQAFTLYYYSGAKRANYNYKYNKDNSEAWIEGTMSDQSKSDGMRIDTKQDMTIRFYGNSYSQNSTELSISLTQNNNQQPWSEKGATKFTPKENMGWNLFGSPYICGMNYSDMEYGRVIYAYNSPLGQYTSGINTDGMTEGYIPPFDAVFTQTATLNSYYENIKVHHTDKLVGNAYQEPNTNAKIALNMVSGEETTRSTASVAHSDALYLNAVSPSEAKSDYDMGADGVKLMSTNAPQLYAIRNGGRYSLLSAVSEAGSVNVGVSLPASGVYSFTVPEACDASKYEAVTLKDAQTGKAVDLLQGEYEFMAPQAGEINNRFTISFNRMEDDLQDQNIKVWIAGSKTLMISGIQEGDLIHVYTASGQLDTTVEAVSSLAKVYLNNGGLMLVEIMRDGKKVAVKKLTIK